MNELQGLNLLLATKSASPDTLQQDYSAIKANDSYLIVLAYPGN